MHVADGGLEAADSEPEAVGNGFRGMAVSQPAVPGEPGDGDPVRREAVLVEPVGQSSYELVEQEHLVGLVS